MWHDGRPPPDDGDIIGFGEWGGSATRGTSAASPAAHRSRGGLDALHVDASSTAAAHPPPHPRSIVRGGLEALHGDASSTAAARSLPHLWFINAAVIFILFTSTHRRRRQHVRQAYRCHCDFDVLHINASSTVTACSSRRCLIDGVNTPPHLQSTTAAVI